jgi:hypothetical protein
MSAVRVPQVIPGLCRVGTPLLVDSRGSFHKILCETRPNFKALIFEEIYWFNSESVVAQGCTYELHPFTVANLSL